MRGICWFLGVLFLMGCGGSGIVPVTGIIKLDDKPLAHAIIIFEPAGADVNPGPGSVGTTDASGRFELRIMTTNAPGAKIGSHRVSITAYAAGADGDSSAPPGENEKVNRKALVPPEYNAKSKLTFDVPALGTNNANFNLLSQPSN